MTLEEFAKKCGVIVSECGPSWGGRYGWATKDAPNSMICGCRTHQSAYKSWMRESFGADTAKTVYMILKENEIMKKQLDGLRDQIMNLPCVVPVQLMTRNDIQIYGWGYVTARKEAAELVAGIMAGKEEE